MDSDTNNTMELKVLNCLLKNNPNRLSSYSGKIATGILVKYNTLSQKHMKMVMVAIRESNCFMVTGPSPLIEKLLNETEDFEIEVSDDQTIMFRAQAVDDSAEPTKKQSSRKDDVGPNKAVARLDNIHDDQVNRPSTRHPPPPPLPSAPPPDPAELEPPPTQQLVQRNVYISYEKMGLKGAFCDRMYDDDSMFTGSYQCGFVVTESFKPEQLHKHSSIIMPDNIGTIDLKYTADFCEIHMVCRKCLHFLKYALSTRPHQRATRHPSVTTPLDIQHSREHKPPRAQTLTPPAKRAIV